MSELNCSNVSASKVISFGKRNQNNGLSLNDAKKRFEFLGISSKLDLTGDSLVISHYDTSKIHPSYLRDENELFKYVSKIDGDLNIDKNSRLTEFSNKLEVKGNAVIQNDVVESLPDIFKVGQNALIVSKNLKTLPTKFEVNKQLKLGAQNLEYISGYMDLGKDINLVDFKDFNRQGHYFKCPNLKSLNIIGGNIKGNLYFDCPKMMYIKLPFYYGNAAGTTFASQKVIDEIIAKCLISEKNSQKRAQSSKAQVFYEKQASSFETYNGMSAEEIVEEYKKGNKTPYRNLAKVAREEYGSDEYSEKYMDLYKKVTALLGGSK